MSSSTLRQRVSDCHTLYVLAVHGVVPRLAVCLHTSFHEECLHHDLHVLRRSSRNVCYSRSMAVGGARSYLCSASVRPSASRTSSRFCGNTMFNVTLYRRLLCTSCPAWRIEPRRRFGMVEGVPDEHRGREPLCWSRSHCVAPLLERLDPAQVGRDEWWASSVSSLLLPHLFPPGSPSVSACCLLRGSTPLSAECPTPSMTSLASFDASKMDLSIIWLRLFCLDLAACRSRR